jgi:nucleotide-binding universal stress UspA family protein
MEPEVVPVSYSTLVIVVAVAWLSTGLTLSLVMGRRGHDAFAWLILGTLFGPLGVIFAVEARDEEGARPELVSARRATGAGPIDVLAGVDGSPESMSALQAALELLGPRLGRLTLATVIPYDSGFDRRRTAQSTLEQQAELVGSGPRLELLHGRPAAVLLERAMNDDYDLLVIGTRGAGLSKALLGSTAVDVAEGAKIPVLLMDNGRPIAQGS